MKSLGIIQHSFYICIYIKLFKYQNRNQTKFAPSSFVLGYRDYKWVVMSLQGAHIYLEIGLKTYSYTDLPNSQGLSLKVYRGARI